MAKQIHKASLVKFQPNCYEHVQIISNNNWYPLFSDENLFKEMLEEIEFTSVDAEKNDFKRLIVEDKLFIGIDVTDNNDFDEHHYLFNEFYVYYAVNGFAYYKVNKTLTKAWRKKLKTTFPSTNYGKELKNLLNQELQEIVDKFNKDNIDLL